MKQGINDIVQAYYQQKGEDPLGLEDLNWIENNNPEISKDSVIMAKMHILSDILCSKKAKKSSQQLFLFLPPLIKLLELASAPQASVALREAADELRSSDDLIHVVLRMTSNALYEIATVISGYEERFRDIKIQYDENSKAILRANHQLKSADSFIKQALHNLFELYHQKISSMTPADLKIFAKLLYALQTHQTLSIEEFKEAVKLLTQLASFSEQDIETLVDAMSLYQSLLIMDGLKKNPKKNELSLSEFSTLFQAPMRHPMLMDQMISSFKNLTLLTYHQMAQNCKEVLQESKLTLASTRSCLDKVNFLFSNNYVIDASFVNEFLTLRQLLRNHKIPFRQSKQLDGFIDTLQLFVQKNNAYFLNKNLKTKQEFHDSFVRLKEAHTSLGETGYTSLFESFIDNEELNNQFNQTTGCALQEFIQNIERRINHGLNLYLRQDNFEQFKTNKIDALNIELSEIHLACSMLDNIEIKQKATQLDLKLKSLSQGIQEDDNQRIEWVQSYDQACLLREELQTLIKEAVLVKEPLLASSRPWTHQFELSQEAANACEDIHEEPKIESLRFNNFL